MNRTRLRAALVAAVLMAACLGSQQHRPGRYSHGTVFELLRRAAGPAGEALRQPAPDAAVRRSHLDHVSSVRAARIPVQACPRLLSRQCRRRLHQGPCPLALALVLNRTRACSKIPSRFCASASATPDKNDSAVLDASADDSVASSPTTWMVQRHFPPAGSVDPLLRFHRSGNIKPRSATLLRQRCTGSCSNGRQQERNSR